MSVDLAQCAELYDGHIELIHLQASTYPRTSPVHVEWLC